MANELAQMVGLTIAEITGAERGSERLTFSFTDGSEAVFYHSPDCCETVEVEDIAGDVSDLIGVPLLLAECVTSKNETPAEVQPNEGAWLDESYTWTFYKFATVKGHVTLRWLGSSNGYYSEKVEFCFTARAEHPRSTERMG